MIRPLTLPLVAAIALSAAAPVFAEPSTETVYGEGQVYWGDVGGQHVEYTTRQQPGDPLLLTSGNVVASDAFIIFDAQPALRTFDPGEYPVVLTLTTDNTGDVLVAYARVQLAPGMPVSWAPATTFATESGIGVFLDTDAVNRATQDYNPYGTAVLGAVTDAVNRDVYWTSVVVDPESGADAVVFSTGYGEGGYTTWWGLDENGQPVALVADFEVLSPALAPVVSPPPAEDNPPAESNPTPE